MAVSACPVIELQLSGSAGAWTNVTADVRRGLPVLAKYGILTSAPMSFVGDIGTLDFQLDNGEGNTAGKLGYYAPDHACHRAGFELGTPVRLGITYSGSTFYKFVGRLDSIEPLPGRHRGRYTSCQALDWFGDAAVHKLRLLGVQTSKRADEVIATIVGSMSKKPSASALSAGQETFTYCLDTAQDETTTVMRELKKLADSELGHCYVTGGPPNTWPVMTGSPTLFWPLDETSGSTYAPAVGACALTVSDTTKTLSSCPGLFGRSASFTAAASCGLSRTGLGAPMVVNYCLNPSFEVNVTDDCSFAQGGAGGSVNLDATQYFVGTKSARIRAGTAFCQFGFAQTGVSVPNGAPVTIHARVRCSANPTGDKAFIIIYDATTPGWRTAAYATVASIGAWEYLTATWTNNTGGAVTCRGYARNDFNDSTADVWFDACQLELQTAATDYCDGAQPRCSWNGTAHNSTSRRWAVILPGPYENFMVGTWAQPVSTDPTYSRFFTAACGPAAVTTMPFLFDAAPAVGAASPWVQFGIRTGASTKSVTASAADLFGANWQLLLGWYDTTASKVWVQVNNNSAASAAAPGGVLQIATGCLLFGGSACQYLTGRLDQPFIITGSYLGAADRAAIYNSGYGIDYARGWQSYDGGGVLTFHDRHTRPKNSTISASLADDSMVAAEVSRRTGSLFNRLQLVVHPREVDSSASVLFTLQSKPQMAPSTSMVLTGRYTDPGQRGMSRVGGASMVTPASGTDYAMNAAEDGGGANLTSNFTVAASYGGNSVRYAIVNGGGVPGYVTLLQARGRGLYDREPVTIEDVDQGSVDAYGERVLTFSMPYNDNPLVAEDFVGYLIDVLPTPTTRLERIEFIGNKNDALMTAGLRVEPGNRVSIVETASGVSSDFFVQGCEVVLAADGTIRFKWYVVPAQTGEASLYWFLGVVGSSELDTTTRLGY